MADFTTVTSFLGALKCLCHCSVTEAISPVFIWKWLKPVVFPAIRIFGFFSPVVTTRARILRRGDRTLGLRFMPADIHIWISGISDLKSVHWLYSLQPHITLLGRNFIPFLPNCSILKFIYHISSSFLSNRNGRTSHMNQTQAARFRTLTLLAYSNTLPLDGSPEL